MRHFVKVMVVALTVLALMLSTFGCAGTTEPSPTTAPQAPTAAGPSTADEPTQAPAPAPTTAAQPAGEVIELKYHHHDPPQSYQGKHAHEAFAKLIEEKTGGKVKVTVYPSETLGKSATSIDMAINGIADISWGAIYMFPGRFPVTDLLSLPMVGIKSARHGSQVAWDVFQSTPEMQKEFSDVHVLTIHTIAPHHVGSNKQSIQTMEDLKGQRIRFIAGVPLKFGEALGATPVNIPMPELFEALQKGTADGYCTDWSGVNAFKFDEVVDYALDEPLYGCVFFMVMNKKKWDSLPPEVQKVFTDFSASGFYADTFAAAWDDGGKPARERAEQGGVEITKLSDSEKARWTDVAKQVWDEYTSVADAKGADGAAILEKIRDAYAKFEP